VERTVPVFLTGNLGHGGTFLPSSELLPKASRNGLMSLRSFLWKMRAHHFNLRLRRVLAWSVRLRPPLRDCAIPSSTTAQLTVTRSPFVVFATNPSTKTA